MEDKNLKTNLDDICDLSNYCKECVKDGERFESEELDTKTLYDIINLQAELINELEESIDTNHAFIQDILTKYKKMKEVIVNA